MAIGEATVEMDWRHKLKGHAAVTVTNDPWTDLQIRPAQTTINKGQALAYEVTANKGGQVRVLTPEDGVQLAVSDANVAQVLDGLNVGAKQEGRTTVVAKLASLSAEATLDVTAGNAISDRRRRRWRRGRPAAGGHYYRRRRPDLWKRHHHRGDAATMRRWRISTRRPPTWWSPRIRDPMDRRNRQAG